MSNTITRLLLDEDSIPRVPIRVLAKPGPSSRPVVQAPATSSTGCGPGGLRLRPSFLFPLSPGLTLPIAPVLKSGAAEEPTPGAGPSGSTKNKAARRRSSAYASWATDVDKPRSNSWNGPEDSGLAEDSARSCDVSQSCIAASAPSSPANVMEAEALDANSAGYSVLPQPGVGEDRSERLSRERSEMLEASRRRDAEMQRRRAEKDAWQVAALAERRREAAERRQLRAEQRQREAEAQRRREELEECKRREKKAAVLAQRHSDEGCPACASDLHGDVLHLVLRFLDAHALLHSAMGVRELWHSAAKSDDLWLPLCREHWATKVERYHLTPEREATMTSEPCGPPCWFDAYREAEEDGAREFIFRDELVSLKFEFRWRRWVSQVASSQFRFDDDSLTTGHPFNARFPWVLDDLGVGIQWGPADDYFPKGFVSRLADWSWRIENISAVLTEVDAIAAPLLSDASLGLPGSL